MAVIKRKKFVSYKCSNCAKCMVECAIRHSNAETISNYITETPPPIARLSIEMKGGQLHMVICHNCGKPKCRTVCEFKGIYEDNDSNILIDSKKCVGCWACVNACIFNSIFKDKERKLAITCDNCTGYDDFGCVTACPTKAIIYDEEPVAVAMCRI